MRFLTLIAMTATATARADDSADRVRVALALAAQPVAPVLTEADKAKLAVALTALAVPGDPPTAPTGEPLNWESGFKLEWADLTPAAQQRFKDLASGATTVPAPVAPVPAATVMVPATATEWGHPVDLDGHLIREHGVKAEVIAGMTYEQKRTLHSGFHQAELLAKQRQAAPAVQQYQPAPVQQQQQVPGYWQPPAQPWGFPAPTPVPQQMPGGFGGFPQQGGFGAGFQLNGPFGGGVQMGFSRCGPGGCR